MAIPVGMRGLASLFTGAMTVYELGLSGDVVYEWSVQGLGWTELSGRRPLSVFLLYSKHIAISRLV